MTNAKKILIVDDDPDILDQVAMILTKDGYDVETAESTSDAEEKLLSRQPDLAILDLMMDERDAGFVLCHRIKKLYPETPVIMMTAVKAATGMSFAADSAKQKGWIKVDQLLDKPVRPETLRATVKRLLGQAAA